MTVAPTTTTVVVPGSFDPITHGHVDIITRAAALFDRVVVGVLVNPAKAPLFTLEQRVATVKAVAAAIPGVEVQAFEGLLVDFAARCGARAVLRGLRSSVDFEYEWPMARMNRALSPGLETVFLAAAAQWAHVSSSLVREVHALGGDVEPFVPAAVLAHLRRDGSSST